MPMWIFLLPVFRTLCKMVQDYLETMSWKTYSPAFHVVSLLFFLIRNSKGSFPLTSYPVHFFGKQSVTSREKLAKPQSPSQICFASTAANKLLPCFPCCVASLEIEEIFLSSPNQKLCFKHKYFALFFSFFSFRLHNSSGFFGYFCCGSSLLLAR